MVGNGVRRQFEVFGQFADFRRPAALGQGSENRIADPVLVCVIICETFFDAEGFDDVGKGGARHRGAYDR